MKKQTVYVLKKDKNEELALQKEIDYWYNQTGSLTSEVIIKRAYSLGAGKKFEAMEGYFFTPEELNEYTEKVIRQTLETAAEKADAEHIYPWTHNEPCVVKESITNTFEETFKTFKV